MKIAPTSYVHFAPLPPPAPTRPAAPTQMLPLMAPLKPSREQSNGLEKPRSFSPGDLALFVLRHQARVAAGQDSAGAIEATKEEL